MTVRPAVVLFVADLKRMLAFYQGLGDFPAILDEPDIAILDVGGAELVLHPLRGEPSPPLGPDGVAQRRSDAYCKPCLPVSGIAPARAFAAERGGVVEPIDREWSWRGLWACDGIDPEGNVFQLRVAAS